MIPNGFHESCQGFDKKHAHFQFQLGINSGNIIPSEGMNKAKPDNIKELVGKKDVID